MRTATPGDAEQLASIYAPIVRDTTISFELDPPTAADMRARVLAHPAALPWLVAVDEAGGVTGYAKASQHRDRAAYRWSVDTAIYVRSDCHRRGVARALYERLFDDLVKLGYFQAFV